tara:strand:+ start:4732 stop:5328 length:597 start_codon:yes stop_codon:yes gene_type:complete
VQYRFDQFIGIFENAATKEDCNKIIKHFDKAHNLNLTDKRTEFENINSSQKNNNMYQLINESDELLMQINNNILGNFLKNIDQAYELYKKKYDIVNNLNVHKLNMDIKIQKTVPGEGYHVWHCENASVASSRRLILCMLYLNDVEEGGETEFLHQSIRIKPRAGTIVLCPAHFTHLHRGNPPLKGNKYMINGWIEFIA